MKTKTVFWGVLLACFLAVSAWALSIDDLLLQLQPQSTDPWLRLEGWFALNVIPITTPITTLTTSTTTTLPLCSWFYLENNTIVQLNALTFCDCVNITQCNFTLRSFGMRADVQTIPLCNNRINLTENCRKLSSGYISYGDKCPA